MVKQALQVLGKGNRVSAQPFSSLKITSSHREPIKSQEQLADKQKTKISPVYRLSFARFLVRSDAN